MFNQNLLIAATVAMQMLLKRATVTHVSKHYNKHDQNNRML